MLAPLEDAIAGLPSKDHIQWTDTLRDHFQSAQCHLTTHKSITLPHPSEYIYISQNLLLLLLILDFTKISAKIKNLEGGPVRFPLQ